MDWTAATLVVVMSPPGFVRDWRRGNGTQRAFWLLLFATYSALSATIFHFSRASQLLVLLGVACYVLMALGSLLHPDERDQEGECGNH